MVRKDFGAQCEYDVKTIDEARSEEEEYLSRNGIEKTVDELISIISGKTGQSFTHNKRQRRRAYWRLENIDSEIKYDSELKRKIYDNIRNYTQQPQYQAEEQARKERNENLKRALKWAAIVGGAIFIRSCIENKI